MLLSLESLVLILPLMILVFTLMILVTRSHQSHHCDSDIQNFMDIYVIENSYKRASATISILNITADSSWSWWTILFKKLSLIQCLQWIGQDGMFAARY